MTSGAALARGLGVFGIALGLAELLATGPTARLAGAQRRRGLVRLFGLREIASGVLLLAVRDPQRWLWVRVAGDVLDAALLGERFGRANPGRGRAMLATAAVAPVVVLDVLLWLDAELPGRRWADRLG